MESAPVPRRHDRTIVIGIVLAVLLVGAILAWPMVRRIVVGPCACTQSPSPTGTPIALVLAWRS